MPADLRLTQWHHPLVTSQCTDDITCKLPLWEHGKSLDQSHHLNSYIQHETRSQRSSGYKTNHHIVSRESTMDHRNHRKHPCKSVCEFHYSLLKRTTLFTAGCLTLRVRICGATLNSLELHGLVSCTNTRDHVQQYAFLQCHSNIWIQTHPVRPDDQNSLTYPPKAGIVWNTQLTCNKSLLTLNQTLPLPWLGTRPSLSPALNQFWPLFI